MFWIIVQQSKSHPEKVFPMFNARGDGGLMLFDRIEDAREFRADKMKPLALPHVSLDRIAKRLKSVPRL